MKHFKITPIWKISVRDGKTSMTDEEFRRYRKWCLSNEGDYEFIIKKKFKGRSLPQNGWFHAVIVPMVADAMGEENLNEAKATLKAMFLSKTKVIKGVDGQLQEITIVGRTSKLSTSGFGFFTNKCRIWAAKFLGINIPDPTKDHNYPMLIDED